MCGIFSAHDKMLIDMEKKQLPFILLKISVNSEDGLPSLKADYIKNNIFNENEEEISLPSDEEKSLLTYVKEQRSSMNLKSDQDLLIGIAWIIPLEISLAKVFLEAFFIDVTCKTNNKKLPLLTITAKS